MRFRRQALRQLETPEQIDEVVRLVSVPSWLVTAALTLIVTAVAGWAVVARVPRTVAAAGILIHSNGISPLDAIDGGQLTKLWVRAHQRVDRGAPLYSIRDAAGKVSTVPAPWDGFVVTWLAAEGELLTPGRQVAELERLDSPGDALQAVVYAPVAVAPLLQPGVSVEVVAQAVPRNVFGTLHGKVATVGAFPETEASLRSFLGNGYDVRPLLAGGTVVRVTIPLDTDPHSPSGLRWSKMAPPFQLNSASPITGRFTVAHERPVDWLLSR